MQKIIFSFLTTVLVLPFVHGQNFLSNNSGLVSIKDGAFLSVKGDVFIESGGVFDNSDSIFLTGDWTNNAGNIGFSSQNEGYVYFIGDDQYINGSDETHFHNVLLRNSGTKYGDIDVYVTGFLDLATFELNMDTNIVYITNGMLDAVRNDSGFVSSLENGGLSRFTNLDGSYFFPVGSNVGNTIYRPIEINTLANPQEYRVRFANADASMDDYDREQKALLLCDINGSYYHKIWQDMGVDEASVSFYYDTLVDGSKWNDIAQWKTSEWQQTPADSQYYDNGWNVLQLSNWTNYNTENFALAQSSLPFADAGSDTSIYLLDTIDLMGNGGTEYTWAPSYAISCNDCQNPTFWHDSTTQLWLQVINEDGCKDIDSVKVTVNDRMSDDGPFIPNAISPNGDNVNDYWYIRWLYKYPDNEVTIMNRWENVVYQAAPYENDWFGTYNGKTLPQGTYYYILKIKENNEVTQNFSGPITILK